MGYDAASWEREGFRIVGDRAFRVQPSKQAVSAETREETFLAQIRTLAQHAGWLVYHTRDSRRSDKGFFDLVLVHPLMATKPGRVIFAEVKSEKGKLSKEQATWLDICQHSLPGLEVYLWRPSDFNNIVQILL